MLPNSNINEPQKHVAQFEFGTEHLFSSTCFLQHFWDSLFQSKMPTHPHTQRDYRVLRTIAGAIRKHKQSKQWQMTICRHHDLNKSLAGIGGPRTAAEVPWSPCNQTFLCLYQMSTLWTLDWLLWVDGIESQVSGGGSLEQWLCVASVKRKKEGQGDRVASCSETHWGMNPWSAPVGSPWGLMKLDP